jgi:nitrite reductase (NO-forming)
MSIPTPPKVAPTQELATHATASHSSHGVLQPQTPRTEWHSYWTSDATGLKVTLVSLIGLGLVILFIATGMALAGRNGPSGGNAAMTTAPSTAAATQQSTAPYNAPDHPTFNAAVPAAPQGDTVDVTLVAEEKIISIAPGIAYHAWTFNGTVPGPILRVRQGQTINFTLTNNTSMGHSIDFHAAETPWSVNYQEVSPGKSFSFSWKAMYPGVFMYHCGTPPVLEHLANGMYGTIIVDPTEGWAPATEYAVVQSEFYTAKTADGSYIVDMDKAILDQPDYVVFNGYANQYKSAPLTVKTGQRIRLFVLNAGPSNFSAFHVIGAMFDKVYIDGNPANVMVGNQTVTIAPGGGAVVELLIPQAGLYPFVTHSFADASKGAAGVIKVTD